MEVTIIDAIESDIYFKGGTGGCLAKLMHLMTVRGQLRHGKMD